MCGTTRIYVFCAETSSSDRFLKRTRYGEDGLKKPTYLGRPRFPGLETSVFPGMSASSVRPRHTSCVLGIGLTTTSLRRKRISVSSHTHDYKSSLLHETSSKTAPPQQRATTRKSTGQTCLAWPGRSTQRRPRRWIETDPRCPHSAGGETSERVCDKAAGVGHKRVPQLAFICSCASKSRAKRLQSCKSHVNTSCTHS